MHTVPSPRDPQQDIPRVIVCHHCGKPKRLQRLCAHIAPSGNEMWTCSACRRARRWGEKITMRCLWCAKDVPIRIHKVQPADYYLCVTCSRRYGTTPLRHVRPSGECILSMTHHAAGDLHGFTYRPITPGDRPSVERAIRLRRHSEEE